MPHIRCSQDDLAAQQLDALLDVLHETVRSLDEADKMPKMLQRAAYRAIRRDLMEAIQPYEESV